MSIVVLALFLLTIARLWEAAYSEMMLAQQQAIVTLTGMLVELSEQQEAVTHSMLHNDPKGLIRSLREDEVGANDYTHFHFISYS